MLNYGVVFEVLLFHVMIGIRGILTFNKVHLNSISILRYLALYLIGNRHLNCLIKEWRLLRRIIRLQSFDHLVNFLYFLPIYFDQNLIRSSLQVSSRVKIFLLKDLLVHLFLYPREYLSRTSHSIVTLPLRFR